MNNVYMLKMDFSPETIGQPDQVRSHVENTLRKALGEKGLADQFSRVSEPYERLDMQMAVVCSAEAAQQLRALDRELGIESLVLEEGRTARLKAIHEHQGRLPTIRP
ncbi:MAG: hypothetical protein NDJ24_03400 [Alphaproteobacteria bacterium]|nr:hypothetical protein [Alphaproteobacteria bacterium]